VNTTNNIVPAATTGQEQPGGWFGRHFGLRFAALFLTLFILASLAWSSAQGTALERLIIEHATVATSARLIAWIAPEESVRAEGARLVSPRVRLSVLNGCDGTESVLLLASAVLAFPVAWRRKPVGVLVVTSGAFVLNQVRLVGLYFLLRNRPEWFEAVHSYIAPVLIIVFGSVLFMAWLQWATRGEGGGAVAA